MICICARHEQGFRCTKVLGATNNCYHNQDSNSKFETCCCCCNMGGSRAT